MTSPANIESNQGQPDLTFCVWPKAFDHTVQRIIDCVFQPRTLIQLYESNSEFVNVKVTNVVKPRFRVSIDPGMLTWRLDNARFAIRADEMALQTVRNFAKGVSGSFTIEVIVTPTPTLRKPSFNVRIRLTCVSSPGGFHLSDTENTPSADDTADVTGDGFQHTAEICLQNLGVVNEGMENAKRSYDDGEPVAKRSRMDDHAVGSTERRINEEICNCLLQAFADMVMEKLNGGLPLQSLHTDDSSDWLFDFSELSMPEFQNGFLASKHLSALRYRDETIQTPTTILPFPDPKNSGRMLTIFISKSVFNAVGYCFHRHDTLRYNLTQNDLGAPPTPDASTLTNASQRTPSLSDCFPELSVKYPGATVEVNMSSVEAPIVRFHEQKLRVTLLGSGIFRARLPDGERMDLVRTVVKIETFVALKLEVGKLTGNVTSAWPTSIKQKVNRIQ